MFQRAAAGSADLLAVAECGNEPAEGPGRAGWTCPREPQCYWLVWFCAMLNGFSMMPGTSDKM